MASLENTHSSSKTRDLTINIRAKRPQRDLIDRAAQALGKNRSDFMLETACREATAVLLDQRLFNVEADVYEQFMKELDRPVADNPQLRALLTAKAPWEK